MGLRLRPLCAAVCLLALTACRGAPAPAPTAAPPEPSPVATTAAPSEPTEPAEPPEPPVEPIRVVLEDVEGQALDSAGLRGEPVRSGDDAAMAEAIEGARAALERYLNAQLIEPGTRFGPEPVDELLAPAAAAALTDEQRPALGQLDLEAARTSGGPTSAEALILSDGADVLGVALHFTSTVSVELPDGTPGTLTQGGHLWFRQIEGEWRAEVVDIALDGPEVGDP